MRDRLFNAFDDIALELEEAGVAITLAELEGLVTGAVCVQRPAAALPTLLTADPGALPGHTVEALGDLLLGTRQWLELRDASYDLFVGDGDIDARTEALARWCEGFMRGVLSGSRKHPAAFPGDAAELTEDILRIAEAVVGSGEAEELERSFTEVHEYLRVAAQLVFEELDRARPPPPHR